MSGSIRFDRKPKPESTEFCWLELALELAAQQARFRLHVGGGRKQRVADLLANGFADVRCGNHGFDRGCPRLRGSSQLLRRARRSDLSVRRRKFLYELGSLANQVIQRGRRCGGFAQAFDPLGFIRFASFLQRPYQLVASRDEVLGGTGVQVVDGHRASQTTGCLT